MITIFDWLEFKEIADELSNNLKEANARAAIILYYYSIFSAVRDYLIYLKHQYQFKNNYKIHERVWKFLLSTEDDNENEIGEFLREVRGIRNHANYDKKYDFDYFLEELINIQSKINNIVSSILYLRDNPYMEF
ncbi:hypothetical protein [Methanobrevibacter sp.]|uniref:hypothetical protein n=1 Tax=Methanobrevibacter sp. TaxID=66852 RepID=UPI00386E2CFA